MARFKTGYSMHNRFSAGEGDDTPSHSHWTEEDEEKQWGRFLIKIRVEIARAFHITLVELENKTLAQNTPPHYAVVLILKKLFRIPDADIRRHMRIQRTLPALYQEAIALYTTDPDFKTRYDSAYAALQSIGRDILPSCASHANLHPPQSIHEESNPYVRFAQTTGKPSGGIRANIIIS